LIERVARSQAPAFIAGESGSGKELAARMIHRLSARANALFVPVNCGAIPETLMESEFFGYRRGAFTGADSDREGFFQAANGGTLFLDEVADLPLAMQVKLLRAIQEKKVRKVGATVEESVDVRIVSATHQDLRAMVAEGRFRQDLFYRLNVIEIRMPPLREYREDIPLLAQRLMDRLANGAGRSVPIFSPMALDALRQYPFPGNVRELENVLERTLALLTGNVIEPDDLHLAPGSQECSNDVVGGELPLQERLDQAEKQAILAALDKTRFNRTAAARLLGVTFRSLRYRMERLGLKD
jgi:two-component system response regulator PilR (NtrC family)